MKNDLKHYYVNDHTGLSNRKEISFRFLDIDFEFTTADNVFSKDRVDQGSKILLKAALDSGVSGYTLDYGCGYGIISIVLSKLNIETFGVDVTDRAIELSKINANNNHVSSQFELIEHSNVEKYKGQFDTVILNPPIRAGKQIIYEMFDNAYGFLKDKGCFYIVIRKQHGAKSAIKKLESLFINVEVILKEKGYWIIKSVKR